MPPADCLDLKARTSGTRSLRIALVWAVCVLCQPAIATAQAQQEGEARSALIDRIAADLPDTIVSAKRKPLSLADQMVRDKIPSVSVAVFRDGALAWAQAWGVADAEAGAPATPATLFQAASISKPVAALAAMRLVEIGTLSLDADISKAIVGWEVDAPITLRQLLSHSAGLTVSGFQGYAVGVPVPTALQVINGEAPANSSKVRLDGQPGIAFNYSGGGLTVAQVLMSQRSGKSFGPLMQDLVLGPLGMSESSFAQPLPEALTARAASGHQNGKVIAGRAHIYPELAAAGLWTTPRDLGKVALDVQDALAGRPSKAATKSIAQQMLTPQIGGYGLGFALETRSGEPVFRHSGLNEGFETNLVASADPAGARMIIVVMTNGQGGTAIANALVRSVAREYRWAAYTPRIVDDVALSQRQRRAVQGYYRSPNRQVAIEPFGATLELRDGGWMRAPILPLSSTSFAVQNRSLDLHFTPPKLRVAATLTLKEAGKEEVLTKVDDLFAALRGQAPLLRGSMNEWGDRQVFVDAGKGIWSFAAELSPGTYEFKIASADWDALNLGSMIGSGAVPLGRDVPLVAMGGNLILSVATRGRYSFAVNAGEPSRPMLRVTASEAP
jgi:CubicO group peptidase (beta-lactamase class C family)